MTRVIEHSLHSDDNACLHRAAVVDDFLESEGIARKEWPAYSKDLNPIENLWDALGNSIRRFLPPPATLRDLETALQEIWRLVDCAVVKLLVTCMKTYYTFCMKVRVLACLFSVGFCGLI